MPELVAPAGQLPWIGAVTTIQLRNVPSPSQARVVIGYSTTVWGSFTLPLDLTFLRMTGCRLYTSIEGDFPLAPGGAFDIPIPNDPRLFGRSFFVQAFTIDAGANPLGATMSNALAAGMGAR